MDYQPRADLKKLVWGGNNMAKYINKEGLGNILNTVVGM